MLSKTDIKNAAKVLIYYCKFLSLLQRENLYCFHIIQVLNEHGGNVAYVLKRLLNVLRKLEIIKFPQRTL